MSAASSRELMRELFWAPLQEQRRRLGYIALALLSLALAQSLFLLMVKGFIKALFQDSGRTSVSVGELLSPKFLEWFPQYRDAMVPVERLAVFVPLTILIAGLAWSLATYIFQLNQQAVSLYVAKRYRERLFSALISLPYLDIRRRPTGEWMSIVMNDVMFLQTRLSDIMTGLVRDSVVIVAGFAVLTWLHWPTALVMACAAPFVALSMGRTGKRIARYSEAFQREMARIAGAVLDLRSRFDFIRSARAEARERDRFAALNRAYYRMIRKSILVRSAFAPALEAVGFAIFALAVYAVGNGLWGDFTPEVLMQFFVALGLLLKPLRELGEQIVRLSETKGALRDSLSTFEAIRRCPTLASLAGHDGDLRQPLRIASVSVVLGGEVRFSGEELEIRAGRSVAIVGPSGAGKSTLVKALGGLVEPTAWKAGMSWRDATTLFSMVSQEPFLFDDTIIANLAYGLDVVPSSEDIWSALALVNVADEIRALPAGLDTRMRAIGSNVSGGQLQRLVIARGILRKKPILLLDEATSAVDAKTERDVTERLIDACRGSGLGLVAVTHRLTWLSLYDEVWFIENGRRQYVGTHAQLLEHARYREYCAAIGEGGSDAESPS